ncbi:MAG: efflux RND transporter periplasmic adaptor subunit [Candidatus Abyssobacteria bacterium SURF_17]|jgi:HlyD family secretion protein|uniref:Efflux RND transporter periplasmic adaptor subunit n=1 Tax=Candidatus Abyssobacteria bacterium SURF_17 TaxID=2093361 RepID=A0A419F0P4_9BACT|nr:MAG: efflux RND transporter periplasmic adaptor subunit [Candidatus Abyssubacteria bacterium SURF_17]
MTIEKKRMVYGALAIVPVMVLGILSAGLHRNSLTGDEMIFAIATRRSFDVSVHLVGHLEAAHSITVSSEVKGDSGKIISIVESGTRVEKGDVLIRLDRTPFEKEVDQCSQKLEVCKANVIVLKQGLEWEQNQAGREVKTAQYEFEVSKMELEKTEKGDGPLELAQLEREMQKAQSEYLEKSGYLADLEELEKQGFSNPTETEQAKKKIEEAKEAYEIAEKKLNAFKEYLLPAKIEMARTKVEKTRSDLEQTKKSMTIRIAKASAELDRANQELEMAATSLAAAEDQLSKTEIRAPIPGLAIIREAYVRGERRRPQVGDTVWQNQPLVYLPDISEMLVNTKIREVDLHKLRKGLPATVSVDAYPETRLKGIVQSIGVLAEEKLEAKGSEKYFQVTIAIQEEDTRLRPGMTASVKVVSDSVTDVLAIPINAIFEKENRKCCYVVYGDRYELRQILVGTQNEDFAEVKKGLSEGERVCLIEPHADHVRSQKLLENQEESSQRPNEM